MGKLSRAGENGCKRPVPVTDTASFTTPEDGDMGLVDLLLEVLPPDGSTMRSQSALEALNQALDRPISKDEFEAVKDKALTLGLVLKSRGRGGAIALAESVEGVSRVSAPSALTNRRTGGGNHVVTEATFNIGQKLTLSQLETFLWKSADILRESIDASEFNVYVLGMLFLKRLSDDFDEAREGVIQNYLEQGKTQAQAQELADDKTEYDKTFYVPEKCRWENLKDLKHDIGAQLNKASKEIEACNPILEGVLVNIDFSIKHKLTDKKLNELLTHFSRFRVRNEDLDYPGLLADASDYLINMFAAQAGRRGGEFCTPTEVSKLIVALVKPQAGMKVYDPSCGSGGMLVQSSNYLANPRENPENLQLFGQERNLSTWTICKLNMFLHGFFDADIRSGDTLGQPQHVQYGRLMQFDRVIANPPFALSNWDNTDQNNDLFNRYQYGIPPQNSADLAFIQHMIASLNQEGAMCSVLPHGALFRGGKEGEIRKGIIDNDLVEAVIGLPPGLFFGTGIPAALLLINKKKQAEHRGKVVFIDASHEYEKQNRLQNRLGEDNIAKIVNCLESFEELDDYSKIVTIEQIGRSDYNLSIKRYVDASPEAVQIKRLLKQYKDYRLLPIEELALEVKLAKQGSSYEEIENALYIPKSGTKSVAYEISALDISHHNVIQVILDRAVVLSRYASMFLQSELGRLMLSSLRLLTPMGIISQSSLSDLKIAIPDIAMQLKMIEAGDRLEELKASIQELEKELVFSPHSANKVLEQVDGMLEAVGGLTDADRVMSLIRQGESASVEFKESFSLDVRKGTSERYIELSSLKTIAAFMNSNGGFLLIGVDDEGAIIGLDKEVQAFHKGKKDKFLLNFKNHIKSRIGEEFYPYIDHKLVSVNGNDILLVECKQSSTECFLDQKDFYVRTNPATDKLEGQKLLDYIRNHFAS
jgi:type I restriction enzyme M protein